MILLLNLVQYKFENKKCHRYKNKEEKEKKKFNDGITYKKVNHMFISLINLASFLSKKKKKKGIEGPYC